MLQDKDQTLQPYGGNCTYAFSTVGAVPQSVIVS